MKIDINKLSPTELSDVAEAARERLGAVTEAQKNLVIAREGLRRSIVERDGARGDVRIYRAEIAELEQIISPKRRRKAKGAPDEECATTVESDGAGAVPATVAPRSRKQRSQP